MYTFIIYENQINNKNKTKLSTRITYIYYYSIPQKTTTEERTRSYKDAILDQEKTKK